ncbi:Crp/Fnr family transcriptional regulator [Streptomyces sp. NPDC057623]|uniref:Crp/Fnr family transcriptional regulator n=1 Tax=Streptomyces sp. NPDC057623 TaxID=3346187 RepID=UPI003699815D
MTDGQRLPISDEQRRELEALGQRVQFPANHVIFWEGQPSRSVLIIQEGHVAVMQKAEDGTEVLLAVRGPGEVMGDEGALMDEPRSATVKAVSDVVGLDITAGDLLRFVDEHHLWPDMYRNAVRRRRESDTERSLLARLTVRSRFARVLLDLAVEAGEEVDGRWEIDVELSQQDMASRVGASREAVAKVLRDLRERGVLETGRRRLTLTKPDVLRTIAAGDL